MQEIMKWLSENKDVVQPLSSLLAIAIGFVSILLTFWTLRTNRKHQRLSVKPIADITANDFEDKLSVILDNKGNGPLVIKCFRAMKDGHTKSNLIDWMPQLPKDMYWANFYKNIEGTALRPSESLPLVEFSLDIDNKKHQEVRDTIRQALSDISVEIEYTDIYGSPMHFPQHSLSWFRRNV